MSSRPAFSDKVAFIWSQVEVLRGDVKAHEYGQFVLSFLVLRRLECAHTLLSRLTENGKQATPALERSGQASQYASHGNETVQRWS